MGVKIVDNIFQYILIRKGKTIGIKKIDDLFFFLSGLKLGAEGKESSELIKRFELFVADRYSELGSFNWKDIIIENNKTDLTDLEFSFKIIEEFLVIEK